jgi:hypothetical protein
MSNLKKTQSNEISNGYESRPAVHQTVVGEYHSRFCSHLPIFVIHCTGPGAFHFRSTEERDPGRLHQLHEKNDPWKQLFRERRLNRISLSDAEKWIQGDDCK